jgi:hypothetical protein
LRAIIAILKRQDAEIGRRHVGLQHQQDGIAVIDIGWIAASAAAGLPLLPQMSIS